MATQVRDLRDRAEVWLATPTEQPNGETDYCYTKVKTIWAAVNPTSGRTETLTGDAERAEITHRVVCRSCAARCTLLSAVSGSMCRTGCQSITAAAGWRFTAHCGRER